MLWDLFKHLKDKARIYLDTMNEQESQIPEAYVILEEVTFDESKANGDGKSLIRSSTYNIRIHARTVAKARSIVNDYRGVLLNAGLPFSQYGPTFDPSTSYYSILITGSNMYAP